MSNRTKLEKRAKELGVSFNSDQSEEELRQLVVEAEASAETDAQELEAEKAAEQEQEVFGEGTKFYKSVLAGLSVQIGDSPERDEQPNMVRFQPYEFRDEARGENYTVGYLATDEPDAQEILDDDGNVEEITEKQYRDQTSSGKKARY